MDERTKIADEIASLYREHSRVEAVALGGSLASQAADRHSDIDLYVYLTETLPPESRLSIAGHRGTGVEIGNEFWEPGDEWIERASGVHVDVIYRSVGWAEDQLEHDQRVMIFLLSHGGDPVREVYGFGVDFELENTLQAQDIILRHGLPLRNVKHQIRDLRFGEGGLSAMAGNTFSGGKIHHALLQNK